MFAPRHARSFALTTLLACSIGMTVCTGAAPVQAASAKKECAKAYVEAQKRKRDGELKNARDKLNICAREACMKAVRADCVKWLDEVNEAMPSLVIAAVDPSGNETLDVQISMDGEVLMESLDAKALEVDPGEHTFRFEMEGEEPIEKTLIVRQGEKNRKVEISFAKEEAIADKPESSNMGEDGEAEFDESSGTEAPILAYVFGGVGVVALGGMTYFWLTSESAKSDLEDSGCAPNCASDDVDSIKTKRLVGDIMLGVGVVSIGVATYLWLNPPKKSNPESDTATRLDVRGVPGGGVAGVSGRF